MSKGQTLSFSTITGGFNAMLLAVCMQFTGARDFLSLFTERDLWQRAAILIPKRIQRLKRIRAQRSLWVWNNNYVRQLSRNSSAGEFFWKNATREIRKRISFRNVCALLCIPTTYSLNVHVSYLLCWYWTWYFWTEFKTPDSYIQR